MTGQLLTIKQVAEYLNISEFAAREMVKRGDITAHKIGRLWRVKQEDIEQYLERTRYENKSDKN